MTLASGRHACHLKAESSEAGSGGVRVEVQQIEPGDTSKRFLYRVIHALDLDDVLVDTAGFHTPQLSDHVFVRHANIPF